MKKVLFVVALGAFAACGSGSNTEVKADSTAVKVDSVKVDTASKAAVDTAAKAAADTTKK